MTSNKHIKSEDLEILGSNPPEPNPTKDLKNGTNCFFVLTEDFKKIAQKKASRILKLKSQKNLGLVKTQVKGRIAN